MFVIFSTSEALRGPHPPDFLLGLLA